MIIQSNGIQYDLSDPIDISIPLHDGPNQLNCYYAPHFRIDPVVSGNFIGDMRQGGLLNYKNVHLNPHGNGTHTECLAHIADTDLTINKALKHFHFTAQLITVNPAKTENGDSMITLAQLQDLVLPKIEALIIRTMPNPSDKRSRNYNKTNPPYLEAAAATFIRKKNIDHLLVDLPSLDREEDGGLLAAHKAFWNLPDQPRTGSTITELIYVPNTIEDGLYLLNLQIAGFEMDATPSKPVLYRRQMI